MFERYTEQARRVIFFSRYEASTFGSESIETEHILLGLLREDRALRNQLQNQGREQIRKSVEEHTPAREKISTSVDLPISEDVKRALAYANQESLEFHHKVIDSGHLILGLLRLENCYAAELLRQHGIDYTSYRGVVRAMPLSPAPESPKIRPGQIRAIDRPSAWDQPEPKKSEAPSLQGPIAALAELVNAAVGYIDAYSEAYGEQRLKRKPWSRKEAFGHLIDWANAHQQWFARALTEPNVVASGYPPDEWVPAQQYGKFPWEDLVDLWLCANRLLVHVLGLIPEEKMKTACHIGIDAPIPLAELVGRYVEHCEDVVGQILSRL
jgi:hypothetical protein